MSMFNKVKENVSMIDAAELYGVHVNKKGMACCPFHDDSTPSMKVTDEGYYCFGCQERGDVIDFTSKFFEISQKDAVIKLAQDFNIPIDFHAKRDFKAENKLKKMREAREQFKKDEQDAFDTYNAYSKKLKEWSKRYQPRGENDGLHPLFEEYLEQYSQMETLIEILIKGGEEDKKLVVSDKETLNRVKKRLQSIEEFENIEMQII